MSRSNLGAVLLAILLAPAARAQESPGETKDPQPTDPRYRIPFFETDAGLGVQAVAQCVAPRSALGSLSVRVGISEYAPLRDWKFEFDEVIPLNSRNLGLIEDKRGLPDVRYKQLWEVPRADRGFYASYLEALSRSRAATLEMFQKSAEAHKNATYSELASEAPNYRGKIITVKGKLTRLREREAPKWVQAEGIDKVYIGEIKGPTPRAPVFVSVFTDLPDGLEPGEEMNRSVTFQGYFLANIRFPVDTKGQKDQFHPYLVGKTLTVHDKKPAPPPPREEEASLTYPLVVGALTAIVVVVFLGVLLQFWFRSGDRKIHSRLASVRDKHSPFILENEPDPPSTEPESKNGDGSNHGSRGEHG